jgi:hypothetical protein
MQPSIWIDDICDEVLREVQLAGFAIQDLRLYLVVRPKLQGFGRMYTRRQVQSLQAKNRRTLERAHTHRHRRFIDMFREVSAQPDSSGTENLRSLAMQFSDVVRIAEDMAQLRHVLADCYVVGDREWTISRVVAGVIMIQVF